MDEGGFRCFTTDICRVTLSGDTVGDDDDVAIAVGLLGSGAVTRALRGPPTADGFISILMELKMQSGLGLRSIRRSKSIPSSYSLSINYAAQCEKPTEIETQ